LNAKWVLQLWRERWGKGQESLPDKQYMRGSIYNWVQKVPSSAAWGLPGIGVAILLTSLVFFGFASKMDFSMNGQISFAGLMVLVALALRVFAGSLISLILICLSALCSAQYLVWRLSETLVFNGDSAFGLAFTFFTLELCIIFYFFLGWVNQLFPLVLPFEELLAEPNAVPTVDVFILSSGLTIEQAAASLQASAGLQWPSKKFQIYVIDTAPRAELSELSDRFDAIYLSLMGAKSDPITAMKRGIAASKGDFILVLDQALASSGQTSQLDKKLLQSAMAWFLSDSGLALLYAPNHCLAPQLSKDPLLDPYRELRGSALAIIRRSACNTEMRVLWNRSALFVQGETPARIDRADSDMFLFWKRQSAALHRMLRFYKPIALGALLLAPLAFLFGNLRVIAASAEWFAAYAIPCVALIGINQARSFNASRWGGLQELRELCLWVYLPLATAVSFLKTLVVHPHEFVKNLSVEDHSWSWVNGCVLFTILICSGFAVIVGLLQLLTADQRSIPWVAGYTVWALFNATLLLCQQAIFQEAQQIKRFTKAHRRLPAMIRLPHGRTMVCETLNFPSKELTLRTPAVLESEMGRETALLIFHNNRSYPLTVQVQKIEGLETHVVVSSIEGPEFTTVHDAIFSRGSDWPQWLAPKNADQPLPAWLTKIAASIPVKMLDLSMALNQYFHKYVNWDLLAQLWAKKK
jgi:cellulose synthase (UDP-forming)